MQNKTTNGYYEQLGILLSNVRFEIFGDRRLIMTVRMADKSKRYDVTDSYSIQTQLVKYPVIDCLIAKYGKGTAGKMLEALADKPSGTRNRLYRKVHNTSSK